MSIAERILNEALAAFDFGAPVVEAVRFGYGHVNDTFRVDTFRPDGGPGTFILQRLSPVAFKHPDEVMANVMGVSEYLGNQIQQQGGDR